MKIQAILELNSKEKSELARILACSQNKLEDVLQPFASAAIEELISMFLGQKVFTRGMDLLEYRLFLLIRHAFGGKLPAEQDVCKLFQLTSTASRSLIRAVMSKYQYSLKSEIDATLGSLLESAQICEDSDQIAVSIHNLNLVEELNRELGEIDTDLPSVRKKYNSVSTFLIKPSSYIKLCERFGVESKLGDDNE